jgi:hypothetical protein
MVDVLNRVALACGTRIFVGHATDTTNLAIPICIVVLINWNALLLLYGVPMLDGRFQGCRIFRAGTPDQI